MTRKKKRRYRRGSGLFRQNREIVYALLHPDGFVEVGAVLETGSWRGSLVVGTPDESGNVLQKRFVLREKRATETAALDMAKAFLHELSKKVDMNLRPDRKTQERLLGRVLT